MTSSAVLTINYAPIAQNHLEDPADYLLTREQSHGARPGRDPVTREFPVHGASLLIVYELDEPRRLLTILGIFHTQLPR
ncbi:MAG: hypothetical protein ABL907_00215 [Hyphomicrobium sp.]